MSDSSFKTAITVTKIDHKVIKSYTADAPKLMKESISFEPFGACTYPNNFAFKLIDDTMSRLVEAGIPQFHFNYLMNFDLRSLLVPSWEPSVFNLSDLEFGFVTWLIACGISIGVFTAELVWHFVSFKLRQMLNGMIFLIVLVMQLRKGRANLFI